MEKVRKTPISKAVLEEGVPPSSVDPKTHAKLIMERLETHYPGEPKPALNFSNPYECVVAAILSEGERDTVTNEYTPALFAKYPDVQSLADANFNDVAAIVHPLRWYHSKARYIIETAQLMLAKYNGGLPQNLEDLMTLPGVSLKTANLIASDCLGDTEGFSVDTHVFLVSHRLGLSQAKTTERTAKDLQALFPQEHWYRVNFEMIEFGKEICQSRRPKHEECFMSDICPYYLQLEDEEETE